MIEQISQNILCWVIIALAFFCYQQLWLNFLAQKKAPSNEEANHTIKHDFTAVLIGALPLLGLLGTITGLLDCFAGIANQGADGSQISAGIGDALLTTQLGLVCAIPAWLLQAWVKSVAEKPASINQPELIG
ncbi:MotA/TolQ/ExbB proton channel family protein [Saccharophagus degradans]|uniref:MotA/TolQ/ExbB proton channel family protein n=1 Tax=Saccharophagus degradans TaxID=86304 RepID=A0AAW7X6R6_9GAMM|nr:MotA/TolQ/ExbB proton channel family protein [Saccharophagus degradans]MBU2984728.1 MotA/TolQ/ExbB proton channel family protein [Saccharophagus degradans]MDO6422431.1 MotA/TolQ/ExbB proton channel family protein [Saccharophagus degradans]MDO6608029.1 MotA/TolQ/ExbB proton channel family protein [Saccharophagus degradans]WGO99738.1 MotA/TolQ/ExbB proton channel family protein [Saccharophagus degradans]